MTRFENLTRGGDWKEGDLLLVLHLQQRVRMGVSCAGNGPSARRNQTPGKLDLLDAPSSLSDPNQHDAVLHSDHDNWILLRGRILVEIQATDPVAVVDLGVPKRRAELR